jgi:bacteriorhodopsin
VRQSGPSVWHAHIACLYRTRAIPTGKTLQTSHPKLILACLCTPNRRYYYLATYICGFAAMAYFAMLSGQGWTAIAGCRQFFYARYADWIVTTTLIVILLGQVANAGNDVIFGACGANGTLRMRA